MMYNIKGIIMEKAQIRKDITRKRNNLDEGYIKKASAQIINNVLSYPEFHDARVVFSYMPLGNEVNVMPLNQWVLDNGRCLCIPRTNNDSKMDAVIVRNLFDGLNKTKYGIMEPAPSEQAIDIKKIDLVLVPGVAFDKEGNRLGYGKGYYDRFLALCDKHTEFWGIAYSFQLLDSVPFTPYDFKVHRVITEV
jgi:5-formyltetrahydrofolate cyclo-ligase